jgi:hypothetical protein
MTVYGSAPRGTHAAVKVLVGIAVVVVLVAAVVVWRSATGDADPAARPAASPASPSAVPSITPATEVSSAPAELSTGSWLVSLSGGSGGYLTVDGDYAALASGRRTVFTVVKGLADTSCFSVRAPSGKYLRHYDYRLRFDKPDDSDLYRKDATFCLLDGLPAGTVRLRSANYPDHVIHSRGKELYIDKRDGSDAFDADSSFTLEGA